VSMMGDRIQKKIKQPRVYLVKVERWRFFRPVCKRKNTTDYLDNREVI